MTTLDELKKYIADVTGTEPRIEPLPAASRASLPLYLSQRFTFLRLHLFEQPVVLAMIAPHEKVELAQLTRQREDLAERLDSAVVLVIPLIKPYERKRLIEKKAPFIVPGKQMYLPMLLVDLREAFPSPVHDRQKPMSWVAQVIVLRHLLFNDMTDRPLSQLAAQLEYTPMAITQAVNNMLAFQLCERIRVGRVKTIAFQVPDQTLWQSALQHMRSPVRRSLFVRGLDADRARLLHAGMTALSERTNLASTDIDTVAMSETELRAGLLDGRIVPCPLREDAMAIIQGWAYNPKLLSLTNAVDPLSLYLSLREDPDERVQLACSKLLETLQ